MSIGYDPVTDEFVKGSRGGTRGGTGPGPGGGFGGAFGGGGGIGFGYQPGGFGATPAIRRVQMMGARGRVPGIGIPNQPIGAKGMASPMAAGGWQGRIQSQVPRPQQPGVGASQPGNVRDYANDFLAQFMQGGAFSPGGNQQLMGMVEQGALRDADALRQRARLGADLRGLDPAQRAAYGLQADMQAGRGVQDIMSQARLGQGMRQDDFAKRLYEQMLQHAYGWDRQDQAAALQRRMSDHQNKGGLGGFLGQVGGAALGGWAGGGFPMPGRSGRSQDVSWMNGMGW